MGIATIALAAAVSIGQVHVGGQCAGDECFLATPRPYPANMVDGVRRPGFNGRLYLRRPVIGGTDGPYAHVHDDPGPDAYGAFGSEHETVWARVNHQPIALDPFARLPRGLKHQERARQRWLRQRGYVGGVRTHVNDAYLYADEEEAGPPEPRATIVVPEHWRRTPTLEVRADERPAVNFEELASRRASIQIDRRPVVPADEATVGKLSEAAR